VIRTLTLAFDTATFAACVALIRDGEPVAERRTTARALLDDAHTLLEGADAAPGDLGLIVAGTGPGSYTSLRMGLVTARVLSMSLAAPAQGVSTLEALRAGAPGALPVIDARRSEVFVLLPSGPACTRPEELGFEPGRVCVGDGAMRYRDLLVAAGAEVPPDDDERHVPWARHHARLAAQGLGGAPEPIYLRAPDADRALTRGAR
jgi:tRNA threonylcarbamoyl adenosine modification protein YeaZ